MTMNAQEALGGCRMMALAETPEQRRTVVSASGHELFVVRTTRYHGMDPVSLAMSIVRRLRNYGKLIATLERIAFSAQADDAATLRGIAQQALNDQAAED